MRKIITLIKILFFLVFFSTAAEAVSLKGSEIVISVANSYAAQFGQKIAEAGGNPIDVAVAMVLTMSVTNPTFSALGGGGFALVKIGNRVSALDFRERAPAATGPDYYKDKAKDASMIGGAAVGVPGLPAGLWELHKRYGKLPWSKLFDEALELSTHGFRVGGKLNEDTHHNSPRFNSKSKLVFLKGGVDPYKPGEILVQKDLANALRELRLHNVAGFYTGPVAKDIVDSVRAAKGEMTLADLADYKVVWRDPITMDYHGYKLFLMPPPSSGGLVIETALKLLDKVGINDVPLLSVDEFHLMSEVQSRAFRGRDLIADPDLFKVPTEKIVGDETITELAKTIHKEEATPLAPLVTTSPQPESNEKPQTTHLSVLDKWGNAVSMTFTLNGNFGSGVATERYGIMLNNEMDDFTTHPGQPNMFGLVQGLGNIVSPGKRPLSSMSPTIVEKNGNVVLVVGAPGGPRIITSVLQVLYRVLGRGQNLQAAVEAPRVHNQLQPNKVFIDKDRFAYETIEGLKARKDNIQEDWQALVYAVANLNGVLEAVVDTRAEGAVAGY
jgi:gamma-glutamyltranspeptidase / glutathione hydrolase